MEKIYSKIEPNKLLHIINRFSDINKRTNIVPSEHFLQCASLQLKNGDTFKAHKHILFDRNMPMAQESWVVISGKVRVFYFDLDDSLITTKDIKSGECSITYRGGHNYKSLEENTVVYEFKTGPYYGIEKDKVFINNNS